MQFLYYRHPGHGALTCPLMQRGYTAFVSTKFSRIIGASGIHTGSMCLGKLEGDASDQNIAFVDSRYGDHSARARGPL